MDSSRTYPVQLTDTQWRREKLAAEFHVLREAGTERPFTGEYTDTSTEGVDPAGGCGTELFRSDAKFDSHCGWPSFYEPSAGDRVELPRRPLDPRPSAGGGALVPRAGPTGRPLLRG